MSKRRITKQQSRRIHHQQAQRLQRAEQDEALGTEQSGLLISCYGTQVKVEAADGRLFRCRLRQNLGLLVAGDRVIFCEGPNRSGVVVAVSQRKSVLGRPNKQGEIRPVAANIDQMVVVIAPQPPLVDSLLDSYLVAAEILQIQAVIVLNKADLLLATDVQPFEKLLDDYQKLGYRCLKTSSKISQGMQQLESQLSNKISVFVGQSGVGKSSLIATLLPGITIAIRAISQASALGKHTTCNSTLFHLPHGGDIIDSPGVREFGLWHMSKNQIVQGFKEIAHYVNHCKFRDCSHHHEPGCAVLRAVAEGVVSSRRLKSCYKLCEKWKI